MNRKIKKLMHLFVHAGIEKEQYESIEEEIREANRDSLSKCANAALLVFGILYIMSFMVDSIRVNQGLYLMIVFFLAVIVGIVRSAGDGLGRGVLPFCYALLSVMYFYAIFVGTLLQSAYPATSFCVLLFAAPFLFIDRPYRMTGYLITMSGLFCIASYTWKDIHIFSLDVVNTASFLALGVACNIVLLQTKVKNIINNKTARKEIDTDGLTGLFVKTAAEREISRHMRFSNEPGALIVIDLDDFKTINDTKGHAFGDMVLEMVGSCLDRTFRRTDIKGRFGGDEFVVFLQGSAGRTLIMERLERFRALMEQGAEQELGYPGVHQSIGIAMYPEDAMDYKTLFKKADEALYEAKRQGKNRYCFYTSVKIRKAAQADDK